MTKDFTIYDQDGRIRYDMRAKDLQDKAKDRHVADSMGWRRDPPEPYLGNYADYNHVARLKSK